MGFSSSPQFEGTRVVEKRKPGAWLVKYRKVMAVLIVLFVVAEASMLMFVFVPEALGREAGGLDGCIVTASGEAASATIRVGDAVRNTYDDGCFFFAELAPGRTQVSIMSDDGIWRTMSVEITAGEASGLGTITLPAKGE